MLDVASTEDLLLRRQGLDETAIRQLFTEARTCREWHPDLIPVSVLQRLYALTVLGPTSANCCPVRIVFVSSKDGKERLLPLVDKGNRNATAQAPVTAIVAYDLHFYEQLSYLYPHQPNAASWFNHPASKAARTALQNSSLQGGYFILAARSMGLDCGPMGGFDGAAIAKEFFPGLSWEVNFLCNLGYGLDDPDYERLPRLDFDEACQMI